MKLEKNGRASRGKKTRHVNIIYFSMKDRIKLDKINIIYYPMEIMVADYFTKPLQCALFKKLHSVLMSWMHPSSLYEVLPSLDSVLEEMTFYSHLITPAKPQRQHWLNRPFILLRGCTVEYN